MVTEIQQAKARVAKAIKGYTGLYFLVDKKTGKSVEGPFEGVDKADAAQSKKGNDFQVMNKEYLNPRSYKHLKASGSKVSAGYTHYWKPLRDFTDQEWKKILRGAKVIIAKAVAQGIALADGNGNGKPALTPEYISLNGKSSEMYETFSLGKAASTDFDFTKTNQKPYDAVVVSILALAKRVASDAIDISSDGGDGVFKDPPISEKGRAPRAPKGPPKGRRVKTEPYSAEGGDERSGMYTISPARYAKGKVIVKAPGKGGFKTNVGSIAEESGGKYTNRERGYVMSPTQAKKFEMRVNG